MTAAPLASRSVVVVSIAALIATMTLFHVVIEMRGMVDAWAFALLLLAAAITTTALRRLQDTFERQPVAFLLFHVVTYLVVAGTIAVHLVAAAWPATSNGGLVWMIGLWGVGLLVHSLASITSLLRPTPRI